MKRRVALFDIDRTMYHDALYSLSIFPIVDRLISSRLLKRRTRTQLHRGRRKFAAGTLKYEAYIEYLLRCWARGLRDKKADNVFVEAERYYRQGPDLFYEYVLEVMGLLRPTHDIFLVTGEPQFIGQAVHRLFGTTGYVSSVFGLADGRFTGEVSRFLAWSSQKNAAISDVMEGHDRQCSFGFGDSEGDVEMLEAVWHPICVDPTSGLRLRAKEKGWTVASPDEVAGIVQAVLDDC